MQRQQTEIIDRSSPVPLSHCPFTGSLDLLNLAYFEEERPKDRETDIIYSWSEAFFNLVVDGMERLRARKNGGLMIEVVMEDGYAFMDELRMGTAIRRAEFPKSFDRIHSSNVPDYV